MLADWCTPPRLPITFLYACARRFGDQVNITSFLVLYKTRKYGHLIFFRLLHHSEGSVICPHSELPIRKSHVEVTFLYRPRTRRQRDYRSQRWQRRLYLATLLFSGTVQLITQKCQPESNTSPLNLATIRIRTKLRES